MTPSEMLRQKKLYKTIVQIDTVFVSDELAKLNDAKYFLKEEVKTNGITSKMTVSISPILHPEDAPPSWEPGALIWGAENDCTIEQWLVKTQYVSDPEYQQYLTLKEKFGNL